MCSEKTIIYLKAYISIEKKKKKTKTLPISAICSRLFCQIQMAFALTRHGDNVWASLVAQLIKESACNVGEQGWEDPLEKGTVTYSSILAWRIL